MENEEVIAKRFKYGGLFLVFFFFFLSFMQASSNYEGDTGTISSFVNILIDALIILMPMAKFIGFLILLIITSFLLSLLYIYISNLSLNRKEIYNTLSIKNKRKVNVFLSCSAITVTILGSYYLARFLHFYYW